MKILAIAISASLITFGASAGQLGSGGVSAIKSNGKIAGNPSWSIRCNFGSGVVIRKGEKWADSSGYSYSDRFWSLSLEDFAKKMCE